MSDQSHGVPLTEMLAGHRLPAPVTVSLLSERVLTTLGVEAADGSRFVVRLDRNRTGLVPNEARACALLNARSELPVPRVLACDATRALCPMDFAVFSWLPGTVADRHWEPNQQRRLATVMGKLLRQLHSVPAGEMVDPTDGLEACADWRKSVLSRAVRGLERRGDVIAEELASRIRGILSQYAGLLPESVRPCLLHRDFKPRNILVQRDAAPAADDEWPFAVSGIIDFEWAMLGDPLLDVASSDVCRSPNPWGQAFLDGYFGTEARPAFLDRVLCVYSLIDEIEILDRAPSGFDTRSSVLHLRKFVGEIETWLRDDRVRQTSARVQRRREQGAKVVVASGCFDLLHVGHVRHLQAAKALGDMLVVMISDDASVRTLKGPSRPIVTAEQRAEVLRSLSVVDDVIVHAQGELLSGERGSGAISSISSWLAGRAKLASRRHPAIFPPYPLFEISGTWLGRGSGRPETPVARFFVSRNYRSGWRPMGGTSLVRSSRGTGGLRSMPKGRSIASTPTWPIETVTSTTPGRQTTGGHPTRSLGEQSRDLQVVEHHHRRIPEP